MSMDQLMALVPIEAANFHIDKGRKSRWEKTKERKGGSRWGHPDDKPYLPPPYVDLPPGLTPAQMDQFLREQRFDELSQKISIAEIELDDPDIRPPSPPPIYDKTGSRTNTRDIRARTSMISEHQRLVEYMIKHLEGFSPPVDYRPLKKIRRIEIPLEKYPEYNFMGLIIGPRGCNHKRLECESGTQISIRGKGTQKEGKKTDHQTDEEASLPMHVHVAGDTEESVERAVSLIEPLLDPSHPMHEEFKKRGLEQLALVNGISFGQLDQQRCSVCSATGHLAHECPDAQQLQNFKKPEIKCAICGDLGHVTMDCKFAKSQIPNIPPGAPIVPPPPPPIGMTRSGQTQNESLKIDSEYKRMMNALSGDPSKISPNTVNTSGSTVPITNTKQSSIGPPVPPMNPTAPPGSSPINNKPITPISPMHPQPPGMKISPIPPPPHDPISRPIDIRPPNPLSTPRGMMNIRHGLGLHDRTSNPRFIPAAPPPRGTLPPLRSHGVFPMASHDPLHPKPMYMNQIPGQLPVQSRAQMPFYHHNQMSSPNYSHISGRAPSPIYGQTPTSQTLGQSRSQISSHMPTTLNGHTRGIPVRHQGPPMVPRPAQPSYTPSMIVPSPTETINRKLQPPLPSDAPPLPPNGYANISNIVPKPPLPPMHTSSMNGFNTNQQALTMQMKSFPLMRGIPAPPSTKTAYSHHPDLDSNGGNINFSPTSDAMDLSN